MADMLLSKIVGVNFNEPTFKMVGGLGIDDVKIKYNWFLNAEVKDAIIGENENGLVWYSGTWVCGTWEGGTWYAGTWYNGRWKKGDFYSYDIDQNQMMIGKLHINCIDISKSKFLGGIWEGGTFHYGIFGHTNTLTPIPTKVTTDYIVNYNIDFPLSADTISYYNPNDVYIDTGLTLTFSFTSPTFLNGDFLDGWMNASIFKNGKFYNGFINNSIWYDGIFYNGIFMGDYWKNGNFYGGDFSNGVWENGILSTFNQNVKTRFGLCYKLNNTNVTGATWQNGKFTNGEFHSMLNIDENNNPIESLDHSLVKWYDGIFVSGSWYGGTFINGEWQNGTFYSGIIEDIIWDDGFIKNCIWLNGTFMNGTISGGVYNNMLFKDGYIGSEN